MKASFRRAIALFGVAIAILLGTLVVAGVILRHHNKKSQSHLMVDGIYWDLIHYADDHDGWLPRSDRGPYDALQKLYPDYSHFQEGAELAGISGDADALLKALKNGEPLTGNLTSWFYVQGLRRDDSPELAVLWEQRAGLFPSGAKDPSGGRMVVFLNGDTKQISPAEWAEFLRRQEELKKETLRARSAISR